MTAKLSTSTPAGTTVTTSLRTAATATYTGRHRPCCPSCGVTLYEVTQYGDTRLVAHAYLP